MVEPDYGRTIGANHTARASFRRSMHHHSKPSTCRRVLCQKLCNCYNCICQNVIIPVLYLDDNMENGEDDKENGEEDKENDENQVTDL